MIAINQTRRRLFACLPLIGIAFLSISWHEPFVRGAGLLDELADTSPVGNDTLPRRSLDDQLLELRRAKENLRQELSGKNWDQIESDMERAFDRIDFDAIGRDVQRSLSGLDRQMEQLGNQHLLERIQYDDLEKQFKAAERQLRREFRDYNLDDKLDAARDAMVEARDKIARLNKEDLALDMAKLREELKAQLQQQSANMADQKRKMRQQMGDQRINLRKHLDDAASSIEKTEKQMEGYKTMISELTKAGLIKDADNYEIECRQGTLYIDGQEQSAAINKKYSKYFPAENTRISNRKGNWNLRSGRITD